jgi:HAD superfamily hydrolase (TIGR01509 family)
MAHRSASGFRRGPETSTDAPSLRRTIGLGAIRLLSSSHRMAAFRLVIFDCDGVLVDSERITNQVFAELLGELGLAFTLDDMFEHFVGHSMARCLEKIAERLGKPAPADFVARYRARSTHALELHVGAVPGIEQALDRIAIPWCVASNGLHAKMRLTLGRTGLLPRFEGKLFSASEVEHPKPAPDLFLHAAARFGVAPTDCAVVEDTPAGIAAAVAAGMTALGYAALTPPHRLQAAGAAHIFDRMSDLPALLA